MGHEKISMETLKILRTEWKWKYNIFVVCNLCDAAKAVPQENFITSNAYAGKEERSQPITRFSTSWNLKTNSKINSRLEEEKK